MCGITGIYNFNKDNIIDAEKLKLMNDKLYHRGPDGFGYYFQNNIGLGHRRLSIIDISEGNQPMHNSEKTISVVFNGEIYNYIELRSDLLKLGHKFKTNSDTEVIIKSYEEWGVNCQNKFNGMWAFALWDDNKKQLFLSRDRIGEKPLIYSSYKNSLIFSSEIKSIFAYGVPKKIREELIELYLVLTNIPGPETFYENVYKLLPGHYIIANSNGFKQYKYWDLPEIDENNMNTNKKDVYEKFTYLFQDSIKIRMRSDVPFGAFLSGGLDSSCIVSQMSNFSNEPIETFTIGFKNKLFDESELAKLVSNKFKTSHHLGSVNPKNIDSAIFFCNNHFDEPFGDSSSIPTHEVSKFARSKVKMVLTGDGGDEVLSGYNSYLGIKISSLFFNLPPFILDSISSGLSSISKLTKGNPRYKINQVLNFIETSKMDFNQKFINKYSFTSLVSIKKLTSNIKNVIPIEEYFNKMMSECNYQDSFYKLMYLNFKHNLPDDYLVKVDRMSMCNSLETRAPFLDYRLIEFMVGVDKNLKMQGFERKSILKNTIGKKLPKEILNASKKGFSVPLREWFKNKNFEQYLQLNNLDNFLDKKILKSIYKDNITGKNDSGNFLWTLIMLNSFMK